MFAGKNVASEIALKLCDSVQSKLEGKVLGTFSSISSTVKETITDACVQILSPHRRIDILRDAMEAKQQRRPFSMVFCGVNGVGKSTNLAKVSDKAWKNICLFPITLPYLVFVNYLKDFFFANPTEKWTVPKQKP